MTADEWRHRAEREAVAIFAECNRDWLGEPGYEHTVGMLAVAWLQGNIAGTHQTLSDAEQAFERMRAAL